MAAWKLAPALAAGCTVVIKPSEETPLSLLRLAQHFKPAGLPDGVVNIITGPGNPTGTALLKNEGIDMYTFTGSTAVGRLVAKAAASHSNGPKPVNLEMGGKSPIIVFKDADLDAAADSALFGYAVTTGQVCSATSKILVDASIQHEFEQKLIERTQHIRLGDGLDSNSNLGPQVSKKQQQRVLDLIKKGIEEGATLLTGGKAPTDPRLAKGNFVEPTLFTNVDPKSTIAQEEIFGPVGMVIPFKSEEEAVALANDTKYGLAASIWTKDINKATRVKDQVHAGVVWINNNQPADAEIPWVGWKQSGNGGEDVLEAFQRTKTSTITPYTPPAWFAPLAKPAES
jgi:betaine-aldehyde dehydrogenase